MGRPTLAPFRGMRSDAPALSRRDSIIECCSPARAGSGSTWFFVGGVGYDVDVDLARLVEEA